MGLSGPILYIFLFTDCIRLVPGLICYKSLNWEGSSVQYVLATPHFEGPFQTSTIPFFTAVIQRSSYVHATSRDAERPPPMTAPQNQGVLQDNIEKDLRGGYHRKGKPTKSESLLTRCLYLNKPEDVTQCL